MSEIEFWKIDFLLPLFIKQVPNLTNLLVIVHVVVFQISSTWIVLAHVQCVKSMEWYVSQLQQSWRQSTFRSLTAPNKWTIAKMLFSTFKPSMLNITVTFPVIALCYQPLSNVPLQIRAMVVLNHRVQKDTRVPSAQLAPQITFSFNRYLECPSMLVRVFSCVLVIVVLIFLFLLIFWGGSNAANGERGGTEADVAMSCVKVVVGFYQVASGIFSAVLQVQWPVVLESMKKILEVCRGEQLAPLSHINPAFRLDPFMQFCLSISFNTSVILLILMYLLLKRQYIRKLEILEYQKMDEVSHWRSLATETYFYFFCCLTQ